MLGDLELFRQRFGRGSRGSFFVRDDFSDFVHADIRDVVSGDLLLVVGFDDHSGGQP